MVDIIFLYRVFNRKLRVSFMVVAILMFTSALLEAMALYSIQPMMSLVLLNEPPNIPDFLELSVFVETEMRAIISFAFFLFVTVSVSLLRTKKLFAFACESAVHLSGAVYEEIQGKNYDWQEAYTRGDKLGYMEKVGIIQTKYIQPILLSFSSIFTLFACLLALLEVNSLISSILIVAMCIMFLSTYFVTKGLLLHYAEQIRKVVSERITLLSNVFESYVSIRLTNNQSVFRLRFLKLEELLRQAQNTSQFLLVVPKVIIEYSLLLIVVLTANKLNNGEVDPASLMIELGTSLALLQKLVPASQQIFKMIGDRKIGSAMLKDYRHELFGFETKKASVEEVTFNHISSIRLQHIHKSYGDSHIIENYSNQFSLGDCVVLFGPSGSGKSTLISLMLGLQRPDKGEITINSLDLDSFGKVRFEKVSFLQQKPKLMPGSVLENISWFDRHPNERLIWEVLNMVEMDDWVSSQDNKLNHIINDGNSNLSGGQLQRLCLARELYRRSSLLILDEPTSALDSELSLRIIHRIKEFSSNKILVIITHDIQILKFASKIINSEDFVNG